jgi:Spy/CpxP family protein refolding chaperone
MLVASSTAVVAQDQPPAGGRLVGGRGGNPMVAMMQGITLTAEQQTKMDVITKKYADLRTAMMADATLDQDARRAKGTENRTKQMEEVKAILTDEQKKVFEKNAADMQARMQGGGRPPAA